MLLSLIPVTAKSQALIALLLGDKLKTDNVKMGLFLCEQSSFITNTKTVAFRPNLSLGVGAYVDVKLGQKNKWILQTYLLFKAPKGAAGLNVEKESFPVDPLIINNMDMIKRNLTYLQLTPEMRYCFIPSFSLGVGPYVGFFVSGKDTYSAKMDKGELSHKMKITKKINPVDFGIAVDLQYRFLKGRGLQLNLRYEQGLINVYRKSTEMKGLNMACNLGIGIPMSSEKKKEKEPLNNDR